MSQAVAVDVHILDKEYRVMCPEEEREALVAAARQLDSRMRQIRDNGRVIGTERIAVMAALNVVHELMQNDSSRSETDKGIADRLRRLTLRIDEALV